MEPVVSDPETPVEMIYNYAISLQRDKNFGLSVPPLRKVVEREPEMAQAWQALATGLRKSKQYGDAAAAYERCLALDPDPKHAFQKGFCHGRKGQFAKAVEAYNRALEMDPTYSKPYYNLGLAYMKLKNYEDALAIFEKAQAAEGESYRLFFNMGACHYGLENDDLAVEMYDLAIARKETSSAWNNLGLALDRMGEKSEAQSCYKKAKALKAEGR